MYAYSLNPNIEAQDQALPWLVTHVLPTWLAAVVVVSVTAAVFSSGDSNAAAAGTYFVPFIDHHTGIKDKRRQFHTEVLRYDPQKDYDNPGSWQVVDAADTSGLKTIGYNAGAFDGRYFYFAGWHDGVAYKALDLQQHLRVVVEDLVHYLFVITAER